MPLQFRSIYTQYEKETRALEEAARPWPVVYRGPITPFEIERYTLQIGVENQQARQLTWEQIHSLPSLEESHVVASKGGWIYRGLWRMMTFQTLLSMFSTPHLYNWVLLESLSGQTMIIERRHLLNWRILYECDSTPLSSLYGGPLLIHNFENFLEFSFPQLKSLTLLENKEYKVIHPATELGFDITDMRIQPGRFYAIHQDRILTIDVSGEIR